jgi:hypothetical protein
VKISKASVLGSAFCPTLVLAYAKEAIAKLQHLKEGQHENSFTYAGSLAPAMGVWLIAFGLLPP